jgi:hypothetical protein
VITVAKITDILFEVVEKQTKNLEELNPEELEHLARAMTNMVKLTTHLVKEYPEFRISLAEFMETFFKVSPD